jgi:plasmid stabilization system protein ParE
VEAEFKLSGRALRDVAEIVGHLHREGSPSVATKIEDQFFSVSRLPPFGSEESGRPPPNGSDQQALLFHTTQPYIIIFRRTGRTAQIFRVVHGSCDLKSLLIPERSVTAIFGPSP